MNIHPLFLLLFIVLTPCPSLNAQINTISGNLINEKEVDAFINQQMEKLGMPGMSVAIINDAEVVYYQNFGVKDLTSGSPVDEHTLFEAASMTKPIFGYTVMKLVEKGTVIWTNHSTNIFPMKILPTTSVIKKLRLEWY